MAEDFNKVKPQDDQAEFVSAFVDQSAHERAPMEDIWDEVENNFLVRSDAELSESRNTANPLTVAKKQASQSYAILKDPETHQEVMTIVSKIALALFPDERFVQARGVGFEDTFKAENVSKLEEYYFRLPGQYLTNIEWLMGTGIYGTGLKEITWLYREEMRSVRNLSHDPLSGATYSEERVAPVVVFDDPMARPFDVRDFYPDTGETRIDQMYGAAKRFKITATEALNRVARGLYEKEATDKAIASRMATDSRERREKPNTLVSEMGATVETNPDLMYLVGYEYIGQTPFRLSSDDPRYGEVIQRNVITVLSGHTVRGRIWPRAMPWIDCRILPRLGSFWGISPGEVIRYDQDFADTLKMMLADAVTRVTHPPHIYNENQISHQTLAKLREFRPGVPIPAQSVDAIAQVQYNPPLQPAFQMYSGAKSQMREATGALGVVQGLGLGVDRASATEASGTMKAAQDRPELFASIVEKDALPREARYVLELYREMLPENDPMELAKRIGESATPMTLMDIMPEYDVKFIGSRRDGGRQQDLAAFREIVQASANQVINANTPWVPLLRRWFNALGAPEIAAMVGNPGIVEEQVGLSNLMGQSQSQGNGNGEMTSGPPVGQLPAQGMGGIVQ